MSSTYKQAVILAVENLKVKGSVTVVLCDDPMGFYNATANKFMGFTQIRRNNNTVSVENTISGGTMIVKNYVGLHPEEIAGYCSDNYLGIAINLPDSRSDLLEVMRGCATGENSSVIEIRSVEVAKEVAPSKVAMHPMDYLSEIYLSALDMSPEVIASALNISDEVAADFLDKKTALTPSLAARLSAVYGRSAESWLAMQADYDTANSAQANDALMDKPVDPDMRARFKNNFSMGAYLAAKHIQSEYPENEDIGNGLYGESIAVLNVFEYTKNGKIKISPNKFAKARFEGKAFSDSPRWIEMIERFNTPMLSPVIINPRSKGFMG